MKLCQNIMHYFGKDDMQMKNIPYSSSQNHLAGTFWGGLIIHFAKLVVQTQQCIFAHCSMFQLWSELRGSRGLQEVPGVDSNAEFTPGAQDGYILARSLVPEIFFYFSFFILCKIKTNRYFPRRPPYYNISLPYLHHLYIIPTSSPYHSTLSICHPYIIFIPSLHHLYVISTSSLCNP